MRQHISVDELSELSPEQVVNLWEWYVRKEWYGKEETVYTEEEYKVSLSEQKQNLILPLLSVGQLIELLRSKGFCLTLDNDPADSWTVEVFDSKSCVFRTCTTDLLAALWQAVKAVL